MTDVVLGQCFSELYWLLNSSDHENSDATANKTKQNKNHWYYKATKREKEICIQYLPL